MNKIEESLPICDEVLASKPTDLDTLNVMMLVLRALGRRKHSRLPVPRVFRAHYYSLKYHIPLDRQ